MQFYLSILFALLMHMAKERPLDTTTCTYIRYAYVETPCFGGGNFCGGGAYDSW